MSFKKTIKSNSLKQDLVLDKEHIVSLEEMCSWHSTMMDCMNRYRCASLFYETRTEGREDLPYFFTLGDKGRVENGHTYYSLKEIYMSYDHIPGFEYDFAMEVFGSWKHWLVLTNSYKKDIFQSWRDELTVKLKSTALRRMMKASKEDSAVGVNAAKYLADEGYIPKKVGRTTKEEKLRQQKIDAGIRDSLQSDMDRIGISVVSGGK